METHRSEFRLGWKTLLAATLGVACGGSPLAFNTIGFFMGPIHQEFGWSFGQISLAVTIMGATAALLAPLYGWLADRYGVRPVALVSLAIYGLIFASFALKPGSLAGFYAFWFVLGLIAIGSTPVTWTRGVNLWFFRSRGLALGLTLAGTSLAAIVLPTLTVWSIGEFGWRLTFPVLALLPLLVALPVGIAFFREPKPEEMPPEIAQIRAFRSAHAGADYSRLPGLTLAEAMRTRQFWLIFGTIGLFALAYGGVHVHLAQMVQGKGYTAAQAAGLVGILGLATLAGRIIAGWLLDRVWAPLVCLPFLSLPAFAAWVLMGDATAWGLLVVSALCLGLASGADDLIAYLAARYFGMRHYGKIYGSIYLSFGVCAAASPAIFGAARDAFGQYDEILLVAMGLYLTAAIMPLALGRYPDQDDGRASILAR
ncbi:MAG: MFS transporter [Steroidobacteraceae bacterium]|jgi:MFS family permease|nr:MFS transporter [Steroidobacteraceae bacterium]